eukprot:15220003-Alexandrium_andersonii.AAC.1
MDHMCAFIDVAAGGLEGEQMDMCALLASTCGVRCLMMVASRARHVHHCLQLYLPLPGDFSDSSIHFA